MAVLSWTTVAHQQACDSIQVLHGRNLDISLGLCFAMLLFLHALLYGAELESAACLHAKLTFMYTRLEKVTPFHTAVL